MNKAVPEVKQSATDGSLALPMELVSKDKQTLSVADYETEQKQKKKKKTLPIKNPYQPFLDKFFPDGNFTPEQMEALCKNLMEFKLQFQQTCEPQVNPETLYKQAIANDEITISSWRDQWLWQARENEETYKCSENTVMSEWNKYRYQPGIIAGTGPSLKKNVHELKKREGIPLVSCAHNFGFFTDNDIKPEYYVQLDAGHIIIDELGQGGKKAQEYYWDATEGHTLIASTVINPTFAKKWKGKILWYNTIIPDVELFEQLKKASPNNVYFQTGGNALGTCYYMSRGILGCTPSVFIGADFSFGYNHQFHPFESHYDKKFSGVVPCIDVYGNRVATWPSYNNFAKWFEYQSMGGNGKNPTFMINCTEGGILGATPNGNINTIKQMTLKEVIFSYNMSGSLPDTLPTKDRKPQLLF